jgi:hypothetical protein
MQRTLATLSLPEPLHIHIGLHTGPVAAGNIGTESYVQYATIGEATNLAARVCGVAEAGAVVVSEHTVGALRAPEHFSLTPLGPVVLKAGPHRSHSSGWPWSDEPAGARGRDEPPATRLADSLGTEFAELRRQTTSESSACAASPPFRPCSSPPPSCSV